jgi:hypothetical protein
MMIMAATHSVRRVISIRSNRRELGDSMRNMNQEHTLPMGSKIESFSRVSGSGQSHLRELVLRQMRMKVKIWMAMRKATRILAWRTR